MNFPQYIWIGPWWNGSHRPTWSINISSGKALPENVVADLSGARKHTNVECCKYQLRNWTIASQQMVHLVTKQASCEHTEAVTHFTDNVFKFIFFYENRCNLIPISLRVAPKSSRNKKPVLVQIKAWPGGTKPLPDQCWIIISNASWQSFLSRQFYRIYCCWHTFENY